MSLFSFWFNSKNSNSVTRLVIKGQIKSNSKIMASRRTISRSTIKVRTGTSTVNKDGKDMDRIPIKQISMHNMVDMVTGHSSSRCGESLLFILSFVMQLLSCAILMEQRNWIDHLKK